MPELPPSSQGSDRAPKQAGGFLRSHIALPVCLVLYATCAVIVFCARDNSLYLWGAACACLLFVASFIESGSPSLLRQKPGAPAPEEKEGSSGISPFEVIGSVVIIALLCLFAYSFITSLFGRPGRRYGQISACKSNLKNIGTALEMYSTDNIGRYPRSLNELTPNYLRSLPTCSSAGRMTYAYIFAVRPDAYTVFCAGSHHNAAGYKPDFPKYDSVTGIIDH
jgi:hypothetical protein